MKNRIQVTQTKLVTAAATVLLAWPAVAQNFNIDFGNPYGVPGMGYGGAAAMPGVWNNPLGPAPFPLVDVAGAPTGALICGGWSGGTFGCAGFPVGSPHARLLDDGLVLGPLGTVQLYTVGPLSAGVYDVYTYAFSPCMPAYRTQVEVVGSASGPQNIGGAMPAGGVLMPGVTHAIHTGVAIPTGGYLLIQLTTTAPGFGSLDGLQIVQH